MVELSVDNRQTNETKRRHRKKMLAPIIIIALLSLYSLAYMAVPMLFDDVPIAARLLSAAAAAIVIGLGVYVLVERIKEIESGEEDDISKY